MTHSILLQNDGKGFLLNDGKFLLLNGAGPEHVNAASGGRIRKKTGRQLTQGDLGPKPSIATTGESISKTVLSFIGLSKSKLLIPTKSESIGDIVPYTTGYSNSQILIKVRNESKSQLLYHVKAESYGVTHSSIVMENMNNNNIKIAKINHYMDVLQEIDKIDYTPRIESFSFNEQTTDPILKAFTHSSSFIGNVRYNRETQGMRILLNGKAYNFCNVPERIFDSFEGANSKGAFFAREIKGQFDC